MLARRLRYKSMKWAKQGHVGEVGGQRRQTRKVFLKCDVVTCKLRTKMYTSR